MTDFNLLRNLLSEVKVGDMLHGWGLPRLSSRTFHFIQDIVMTDFNLLRNMLSKMNMLRKAGDPRLGRPMVYTIKDMVWTYLNLLRNSLSKLFLKNFSTIRHIKHMQTIVILFIPFSLIKIISHSYTGESKYLTCHVLRSPAQVGARSRLPWYAIARPPIWHSLTLHPMVWSCNVLVSRRHRIHYRGR